MKRRPQVAPTIKYISTVCLCADFLFRFVCRWAGGASPSPTIMFSATVCLCADFLFRSCADGRTTNGRPYGILISFCKAFFNKNSLLPKRQKGSFTFPKGIFHICESKYFIPQGFHLRFAQISLKKHPFRGAFS